MQTNVNKYLIPVQIIDYQLRICMPGASTSSSSITLIVPNAESEKRNDAIGRFLTEEKLAHFNSVVKEFLMANKPFLQPRYSLRELSTDVDIAVNYLSAFINRYHRMNYNDFINRYRVSQSKEMIMNGEWKHKTLEGIASESGFNNRNTFTTAFKKETGQHPSEFLKGVKKRQEGKS